MPRRLDQQPGRTLGAQLTPHLDGIAINNARRASDVRVRGRSHRDEEGEGGLSVTRAGLELAARVLHPPFYGSALYGSM